MSDMETGYYCPIMDAWLPALPNPYYHRLLPFLWKRLTGWEDEYGRPAHFIGWRELFSRDF